MPAWCYDVLEPSEVARSAYQQLPAASAPLWEPQTSRSFLHCLIVPKSQCDHYTPAIARASPFHPYHLSRTLHITQHSYIPYHIILYYTYIIFAAVVYCVETPNNLRISTRDIEPTRIGHPLIIGNQLLEIYFILEWLDLIKIMSSLPLAHAHKSCCDMMLDW